MIRTLRELSNNRSSSHTTLGNYKSKCKVDPMSTTKPIITAYNYNKLEDSTHVDMHKRAIHFIGFYYGINRFHLRGGIGDCTGYPHKITNILKNALVEYEMKNSKEMTYTEHKNFMIKKDRLDWLSLNK